MSRPPEARVRQFEISRLVSASGAVPPLTTHSRVSIPSPDEPPLQLPPSSAAFADIVTVALLNYDRSDAAAILSVAASNLGISHLLADEAH